VEVNIMSKTFSARLNRLFDTVYPPGRGPHTSAEVIGALDTAALNTGAAALSTGTVNTGTVNTKEIA
jgi:hypothetical protein